MKKLKSYLSKMYWKDWEVVVLAIILISISVYTIHNSKPVIVESQTIFNEQGIILDTSNNELKIVVDGSPLNIKTYEQQTLFALVTSDNETKTIEGENTSVISGFTGEVVEVYSGNELIYRISGYEVLGFDLINTNGGIIMKQVDSNSVKIHFSWE